MNITFKKGFWAALGFTLGVAFLAITVLGMIFASIMSPALFAIGLGAQAVTFFGSLFSGFRLLCLERQTVLPEPYEELSPPKLLDAEDNSVTDLRVSLRGGGSPLPQLGFWDKARAKVHPDMYRPGYEDLQPL